MEDVLLYDRYLRESEDPGVSADELLSTLGDSEKEAILEKLTLLSSFTDEECEAQRLATTEELIRSILPIGMKVYACLFSAGLEHFTPTSAHPIASSLTPADRAVLVLLVALPSLFNDEVCLAMAEVAQVFYDEPPTAEEAERAVGMRPTPTDYRCLAGLLKDVYTRSQELRQLIHLDQLSHQTRQVQLLDRFLVTRIRETRPPPVVVPLSPESSQRGMAPPLTLAQSLSTRVAAAQSHTATTAPAASLTATYNRQQTGKEEVDPYASYMQKSTPASTVPRAPKSKVELKRKKDEMIKNSLRQLPQGKQ
ncbi:hypothetical protein AGDE_15773 [Angomonas deanei]|uniref:Uncharacterized protein n=1 Tax=Angomonas deanei TaxID=59799 RepID=A0A7G2CDJ5_9TRYP|nr:hypothetical protein AGDE_15773 [Angomonas deanei]CAD2216924.1 hypothetical protein, conserved [Angomonas deanei]|eukprot:EPY18494.1 hypothetical protein AGDE_15773 [Angomonas deanei]